MKEAYVVIALKAVEPFHHGYLVAVFSKKARAIKCADAEDERRGGKYGCSVYETIPDPEDFQEVNLYKKEVYRSRSLPKK